MCVQLIIQLFVWSCTFWGPRLTFLFFFPPWTWSIILKNRTCERLVFLELSLLCIALKYYFIPLEICNSFLKSLRMALTIHDNCTVLFLSALYVNFTMPPSPESPGSCQTDCSVFQHWHLFLWNLPKGPTTFSVSTTMMLFVWNCGKRIQPFSGEPHFFTIRTSGFLVTALLSYTTRKAFSSYWQILVPKQQNMMILKNLSI